MQYFELRNGDLMPMLGLGTWKMAEGVAYESVKSAIAMGYRHIDCAWIYQNEFDVGKAIKECIDGGIVARDELWITTKLWNDCHRPEHVIDAIKGQLNALQLDYFDLYLIHWPVAQQHQVIRPEDGSQFLTLDEVPLAETWQAILDCASLDLCRHVGVANFSGHKIDQLIEATGVLPACNQVESHPLLQQQRLFEYCHEKGIAFVAYSPLGSGDRPDALKRDNEPDLFELQAVKEIADQRQKTPAQILLAWAINRGAIAIPKSSNRSRQQENLQAVGIELLDSEMSKLATLDRHFRYVDGSFWEKEGGPYTVSNLWDE